MKTLPKGWAWRKLGEICHSKGQYGSGAKKVNFDGKVRYIRITDIDDDGHLNDELVSPSTIEEDCFLEENDLLFARSGSVGRTYLHNKNDALKYQFAGYLIRFRINSKIADTKYIFYITKSPFYFNWVESLKRNMTISNINAKEYASFEIPIPSLLIQKQIVAILESAEKLKERRQKTNDEANTIIQSLFYEMFGDPNKNEKRWEILKVQDVTINHDSRRIPVTLKDREKAHAIYPYYGASGIIDYVDEYIFDFDAILIGEDGANLLARSTPIAFKATGKYWVNNHAHILTTNSRMNPEYLLHFFNLISLKPYITGSAQPKLTGKALQNIQIPVPSISLQNQFAARVQTIESLKAKQKQSTEGINTLFNALMQKAFNGELVSA